MTHHHLEHIPHGQRFALPVRMICVSFAAVIITGTLLLMLPISARNGVATPFSDALFTATSATCVTGLVVYDTFTHWSTFGHVVILGLIQCGGLGLVTFTTFFNILIGRKMGLRDLDLAKESVSNDSLADTRSMVTFIMASSMIIELVGALLLATRFVPIFGTKGMFMALFTSISAFCNAGFDLMGMVEPFSSLTAFTGDPVVTLVVPLLIILGGLGFVVYFDLIHYRKTKHLTLHTRIVLFMTAALILLGTVMVFVFEFNNPRTMGHMPFLEQLGASFFQSVTCRTAGFNSIDLMGMRDATKLGMTILMFVGAAPASTGGGIKVTTLSVVVMTVISVIRGRDDTVIQGRRVQKRAVYKALAVSMIAMLAVAISVSIIYIAMEGSRINLSVIDVLFEEVSAFATVGLSVGVTGLASRGVRYVLIFSMFIGRVGPVSLALSMAMRSKNSRKEILPDGKILIG